MNIKLFHHKCEVYNVPYIYFITTKAWNFMYLHIYLESVY